MTDAYSYLSILQTAALLVALVSAAMGYRMVALCATGAISLLLIWSMCLLFFNTSCEENKSIKRRLKVFIVLDISWILYFLQNNYK